MEVPEIWKAGNLGDVKTTLEIPDDLYRAVKVKAALEGRRVTDVVVEGLRLVLQAKPATMRQVQLPIIKSKPGGKKPRA